MSPADRTTPELTPPFSTAYFSIAQCDRLFTKQLLLAWPDGMTSKTHAPGPSTSVTPPQFHPHWLLTLLCHPTAKGAEKQNTIMAVLPGAQTLEGDSTGETFGKSSDVGLAAPEQQVLILGSAGEPGHPRGPTHIQRKYRKHGMHVMDMNETAHPLVVTGSRQGHGIPLVARPGYGTPSAASAEGS